MDVKTILKNHAQQKQVNIFLCKYPMPTIQAVDGIENKQDVYRGEDFMKKFCQSLREHLMKKIINFVKKKMIPLTNKQQESYEKTKICCICIKTFQDKDISHNNNCKFRDHCHYTGKYIGAVHSICNLKYSLPKEIPVVFHNGSNFDYQFIIKKLEKEFEGENTEKYKTFSVPITKEIKIIGKNGEEIRKAIPYKLQFTDSARIVASLLSNLVDNLEIS